jgi:MYXO-CTERM domain-containing protein
VMTFDGQRVTSYHRTVVDEPLLVLTAPLANSCVPGTGGKAYVAVELDGGSANVVARINEATPIAARAKGGWTYEVELPALAVGTHTLHVTATSATGTRVAIAREIEVCGTTPPPLPAVGWDWAQLGGGPSHRGSRTYELAPPLTMRWAAAVGGHVLTAPPLISGGTVFVAVTDLADGDAGGVVAIDLATGTQRWRATTALPLRGGIALADGTVIAPLVDGTVLGLDSSTGTVRWKQEISRGFPAQAGAIFAPPTTDFDDVLVGHQRTLAAFTARSGDMLWHDDPVPEGENSQSASAVAIHQGIAVGTFNRAFGGVIAWDRYTGKRLWGLSDNTTIAINASPVMDNDSIYVVNGSDVVIALDHFGQVRWRKRLDPDGFEWGNATIGTPALAKDILVVPTLYRDLVGMNALTGAELWRFSGRPGPIRTTHYRGGGQSGFAASPVITGDIVWAADTSGMLSAVELSSGRLLWQVDLGVPALAGLAVSRDWIIAATYDGTVRALVPIKEMCNENSTVPCIEPPAPDEEDTGCCSTTKTPMAALVLALFTLVAVTRRRRR